MFLYSPFHISSALRIGYLQKGSSFALPSRACSNLHFLLRVQTDFVFFCDGLEMGLIDCLYINMATTICMTCKSSLCLFAHGVLQLGGCRHYEASLSKLYHLKLCVCLLRNRTKCSSHQSGGHTSAIFLVNAAMANVPYAMKLNRESVTGWSNSRQITSP